MENSSHSTAFPKRNSYSLDGLLNTFRRFAKRCREADQMIRTL